MGFVCPDCRCVFRAPSGHDGEGVICPSCTRLLRLPKEGDEVPPLREPKVERDAEGMDHAHGGERIQRKRRSKKQASDLAATWEKEKTHRRSTAGPESSDRRILAWSLLLGLFGLVALAFVVFKVGGISKRPPAMVRQATPPAEPVAAIVSDAEFLAAAAPLAKTFLEAKTVDEMLPVVRDAERIGPAMRDYYRTREVVAEGLNLFDVSREVKREGNSLSVLVRTKDYAIKQLVYFPEGDSYRIDWEGWVGWSPMDWQEFKTIKPETPMPFRVVASKVDYYNFDFADDEKWRSYHLLSPDGEHTLYGYVERQSILESRLAFDRDSKASNYTLMLRFPTGATRSDQVIIDDVLSQSWSLDQPPQAP